MHLTKLPPQSNVAAQPKAGPPATGALVCHGAQHHQMAQRRQQQAKVEGAGGVVGQLVGISLLLHRAAGQPGGLGVRQAQQASGAWLAALLSGHILPQPAATGC
jgi:hypothetical protein